MTAVDVVFVLVFFLVSLINHSESEGALGTSWAVAVEG